MRKIVLNTLMMGILAFSLTTVRADILIATVGPMSGTYASFGSQFRDGANMAVADINAAGGVLGENLVLEIADDVCDPQTATYVANDLVAKGVAFVAGHFCSGSSIPASDIYSAAEVIQISPGSTNPAFTDEGGAGIYRVCGRDDQQGIVAGDYIADNFPNARVAILHDNTVYGKGLADETRGQLNQRGVMETMYESYVAGESDYTALVTLMKSNGIDVMYVGGYHTEAGLIVRQARAIGLGATLISGDALVTQEFWQIAGSAAEGTLMTFSPDPRKRAEIAPLVQRFRDAGIEPEGYVLYTYAAIQAWAQAVEMANSKEFNNVVNALNTNEFSTVLGNISFDAQGDPAIPGYVFYTWSDGTYDYVQ